MSSSLFACQPEHSLTNIDLPLSTLSLTAALSVSATLGASFLIVLSGSCFFPPPCAY